jgi:hypothetical protein
MIQNALQALEVVIRPQMEHHEREELSAIALPQLTQEPRRAGWNSRCML